jgi:hypothetical protein
MNQHAGDKFNWALLVADFFSRICFEPLVLTSSKSVVVFFCALSISECLR